MTLALKGIKVVDVSQVIAVPMAARFLGDFGAEVIHVETPAMGDSWRYFLGAIDTSGGIHAPSSDINYPFEIVNRNKQSLTLDLSKEDGQTILNKLLEDADVFLTNMVPGRQEKYRIDYATLHERYPKLIHGSVSGVGKNGPERDLPHYDATAFWYRSGMHYGLSEGVTEDIECRSTFGDSITGMALYAGIMTALYARKETGIGQQVDLSLFNMGVFQMSFDTAGFLAGGTDYREMAVKRRAEQDDAQEPPSGAQPAAADGPEKDRWLEFVGGAGAPMLLTYRTKDGRSICTVPPMADTLFPKFIQAIDREDLLDEPHFATHADRVEHFPEVYQIIRKAFLTKTVEEWRPILNREKIAWAPEQTFREVFNDPQAQANDFFVPFDHPDHGQIQVMANPLKLSETPSTIRSAAPELGQHTGDILLELGYSWEEIADLQEKEVIA